MNLIIALMCSYLYTDFLGASVFAHLCGCKYSKKLTVFATLLLCGTNFAIRSISLNMMGLKMQGFLEILMMGIGILYVILLFSSTVIEKIFVFVVYIFVQANMGLVGMNLAGILTGEYAFMDVNSNFTIVMIVCSSVTITLGSIGFVWLWNYLRVKDLGVSKLQWMSLILPLSQYCVIQGVAVEYIQQSRPIPTVVGIGVVLALLADIYMVLLFEKSTQKRQIKLQLKQLKHQYELEQLRYEQLKESYEESAKIRHDFQNYILTLKQMKSEQK